MKPETIERIHEHALAEFPKEACGIVIAQGRKEVYVPCTNAATDPTQDFMIAKDEIVRVEAMGEITAIAHSHPNASPRPSPGDVAGCEAYSVPWYIVAVHTDPATPDAPPYIASDYMFEPTGYRAPLRGREFVFGVQDCYTLVQDFYEWELGITLPHFDRTDKFWERGEELYLDNFRSAGFDPIPAPSQRGDVILMAIRSNVTNHAAVWLGEADHMLHHPYNHLSERTVYGGYWLENTTMYIRKVR